MNLVVGGSQVSRADLDVGEVSFATRRLVRLCCLRWLVRVLNSFFICRGLRDLVHREGPVPTHPNVQATSTFFLNDGLPFLFLSGLGLDGRLLLLLGLLVRVTVRHMGDVTGSTRRAPTLTFLTRLATRR